MQGMVGGTASHLRGGRFQDGFIGAVVSKGVDLGLKGQNLNIYQEGGITVIAGGLSSQAVGGSFEDGAIQAGMVFLYNQYGKKKLTNPTGKGIRSDRGGDGRFGAPRGSRTHKGLDFSTSPEGQVIVSPDSGRVDHFMGASTGYPIVDIYPSDPNAGYDFIRILYVDQSDGVPSSVNAGDPIGNSVNLQSLGYPSSVGPHIHLQIYSNGNWIDPTPFFFD